MNTLQYWLVNKTLWVALLALAYWKIALIFVLALAYFVSMLPRDITWVSVGSDGPDYMLAAKFFGVAPPTGELLYTPLGALWLRVVPIGSEWWRYSLLSAVFSAGTAAILYAATRRVVAPLVYLASGIVVSQSTILELYAPVTFFMVLAWWLHGMGYRAWGYAAIGLGLAVHHLAGFMFLGLLGKDYLQKQSLWTAGWAILIGLPWYAYIPLANRPPYVSVAGESLADYKSFFLSQGGLLGGLAVLVGRFTVSEDFRERVWDLVRILLALGPGLVVLTLAIKMAATKKSWLLPIVMLGITIYWFTDLDPRVYTYLMPAIALAAILIGSYDPQVVPGKWFSVAGHTPQLRKMVVGFSVVIIAANLWAYDIGGRWVDPNHSAEAFRAELAAIPPNSIVWTYNRGWEAMTAELYNYDHGTRFNTVLMAHQRQGAVEGLEQAFSQGRLFRTVIVDAGSYLVRLEPTTPERVLREADEQNLANYQRKPVHP